MHLVEAMIHQSYTVALFLLSMLGFGNICNAHSPQIEISVDVPEWLKDQTPVLYDHKHVIASKWLEDISPQAVGSWCGVVNGAVPVSSPAAFATLTSVQRTYYHMEALLGGKPYVTTYLFRLNREW